MIQLSFDDIGFSPNSENGAMIALTRNWLLYVKSRLSNSTFKEYRSAVSIFLDNLPPNTSPDQIKPKHIEQFLQFIVINHRVSTANTYLAALKSFYRWAENFDNVPNIASSITKLRQPKPVRRIITDTEYQQIIQSVNGTARAAIQFLANTGLRRNEFRFLSWADFNGDFVHVIGKGSKDRYVPLNQICKKLLTNHSDYAPAFVKKYRPYKSLYKLCAQVSEKANVPHFYPHSFRHFFATRLIKKGVPLMVVSKILGHSSTDITEKIYVHLQNDDLKVTDCLES